MHTPGPWKLIEFSHKKEWSHWVKRESKNKHQRTLAAICYDKDSEANASLIVTAPELLQVAKDVYPIIQEIAVMMEVADSETSNNSYKEFFTKLYRLSGVIYSAINKAERKENNVSSM